MKKGAVLFAAMALAFPILGSNAAQAECGPEKKAPSFEAKLVQDPSKTVRAADLFPGKTTIVSFFATWCRPCKEEIPELKAMASRYADRGFQVVLVSLDRDRKDAEAFLASAGAAGLPALWDGDRKLKDPYRVSQLPTNVRVDPDGCVGASWTGYLPEKLQDLENHLKKLPKTTR